MIYFFWGGGVVELSVEGKWTFQGKSVETQKGLNELFWRKKDEVTGEKMNFFFFKGKTDIVLEYTNCYFGEKIGNSKGVK